MRNNIYKIYMRFIYTCSTIYVHNEAINRRAKAVTIVIIHIKRDKNEL